MTEDSAPPEVDDEEALPSDHPRYEDLVSRHRIEAGIEKGITHLQGMHAEGRGSTFDYLLGEETIPSADEAARAGAAELLLADHPVLSVNGNVAALVPEEIVELADVVDAKLEVNLFNRSETRVQAIADHLREHGATEVLGVDADATLPNLDHERAIVDSDGIAAADVVLVPLEDGDRAAALDELGKTEIVVDLNPLSRSPQVADVPIVDNVLRAIPNMIGHAKALREAESDELESVLAAFDREQALTAAEERIRTGR